jgi:hypothetical protein
MAMDEFCMEGCNLMFPVLEFVAVCSVEERIERSCVQVVDDC